MINVYPYDSVPVGTRMEDPEDRLEKMHV